jgi:Flp pilus assembly protein TadG
MQIRRSTMWVPNGGASQGSFRNARQAGVAAVEFAIVASVFFLFIFGIMELVRVMYVINTLQEVTRRAAVDAAHKPTDNDTLAQVRANAIFRDGPGILLLADPVTDAHVRIDYLALLRNADGSTSPTLIPPSSVPSTPAQNRVNCAANANAPNCVRLVRTRICAPSGDGACPSVPYKTLFSMIELPIPLPTSTTIVPVQGLGYTPSS